MTATSTGILDHLAATLRDAGLFAEVGVGESPASTSVPRARVLPDGAETFDADDAPGPWWRLRARVVVTTRGADGEARAVAPVELAEAAAEALLADPYRDGLCRDLPVGRATEIVRVDPLEARSPQAAAVVILRCHFEEPA